MPKFVLSSLKILTLFVCLFVAGLSTANAQRAYEIEAYASSGTALQSEQGIIRLWGLNDTTINDTVYGLKAKALVDELINNNKIECAAKSRIQGGIVARCINAQNLDLALELIKAGLGTTNRFELQKEQQYLKLYSEAERRARIEENGFWNKASNASAPQKGNDLTQIADAAGFLAKDILLIAGVFMGPIIGMLIVAAILYFGLDRMTKLQKKQIMMSQQREKELRDREKFVLAASIESEINTNRAKIDAFTLIYEDMLRNLRDPSKTPKYQQSGDIIHQRPSLSRAVYDANLDRMDLVGPQVFTELSEIYAKIDPNPDYYTLEPDTPIEQVIDKVQKILRQVNDLIDPMEKVNSALSMIIRERKKKVPQPTPTQF